MDFYRNSLLPPVIKNLIIANVIVFVIEHIFGALSIAGVSFGEIIFQYGALSPIDSSTFYPWQIITYQFLHGDFWHIFFNMFMLWMFGNELANLWGTNKFLTFYLLSGIGAALIQLFITPMIGSVGPTVGASGSIYGIFLAFAFTYPNRPILIFPLFIPIKAKYLIIGLVVMDFLMGFSASSRVAHFAHIGGALTGWLLLKYGDQLGIYRFIDKILPGGSSNSSSSSYWNSYSTSDFWQNTQRPKRKPKVIKVDWFSKEDTEKKDFSTQDNYKSTFHVDGEEITQSKIDEILDKISESGYNSLTEREKNILFELSKKIK